MWKIGAAMIVILAASTVDAHAQGQCMASLPVLPNRNVTVLDFSGPASSVTTTMSCSAAELMRQRMFASDAIGAAAFDDLVTLRRQIADVSSGLEQQRAALSAAKTKAARTAAFTMISALAGVAGVVTSVPGCIEWSAAKCVGVIASAAAIYKAVDDAAKSAGDGLAEAKVAVAQIDALVAVQSELAQKLSAARAAQYKSRYGAAQMALCASITRQCLK